MLTRPAALVTASAANFLHHTCGCSQRDHGTVIFTFALLAFLFYNGYPARCCLVIARPRRLHGRASYLEYTSTLDMLGGLLAGMCGCLGRNCCGRAAVMASTQRGCSACIVSASRCRFVKAGYAAMLASDR